MKTCFVVCYDEVAEMFWVLEKEFKESDREHVGTMVFFNKEEAERRAKKLNEYR